jgi:hypothetical protein
LSSGWKRPKFTNQAKIQSENYFVTFIDFIKQLRINRGWNIRSLSSFRTEIKSHINHRIPLWLIATCRHQNQNQLETLGQPSSAVCCHKCCPRYTHALGLGGLSSLHSCARPGWASINRQLHGTVTTVFHINEYWVEFIVWLFVVYFTGVHCIKMNYSNCWGCGGIRHLKLINYCRKTRNNEQQCNMDRSCTLVDPKTKCDSLTIQSAAWAMFFENGENIFVASQKQIFLVDSQTLRWKSVHIFGTRSFHFWRTQPWQYTAHTDSPENSHTCECCNVSNHEYLLRTIIWVDVYDTLSYSVRHFGSWKRNKKIMWVLSNTSPFPIGFINLGNLIRFQSWLSSVQIILEHNGEFTKDNFNGHPLTWC